MLIALRTLLFLLVMVAGGYGSGALWFRSPGRRLRIALLALWLAGAAYALWGLVNAGWVGPAVFLIEVLLLAGWWRTVRPSHDRPWADDVARLLDVRRDGPRVTLGNVRNFDWRSETDYTPRWEVREYDLDQLFAVDLVVSHWAGPMIAHTLVSFAFADGRHLVFSVEVRRVEGEVFSAVGGLFRQCELALVAADERDIIRTRTTARGEDVYLYRVAFPRDNIRALFEAYLDTAKKLRTTPRFYNTLTSNCATLVYDMVKTIVPRLHWNWRLLASGHLPGYLYNLDVLDSRLKLDELRRRGWASQRAIASDVEGQASPAFSEAIRRGLPVPEGCSAPPP